MMEVICKIPGCGEVLFKDIASTDELSLPENRKKIGEHLAKHEWTHFFMVSCPVFVSISQSDS